MGRESKITPEDIFREADICIGNGIVPEARLIRNKLGVGSLGTVQKHLQEWRAQRAVSDSANCQANYPEIIRAIEKLLALRVQEATADSVKEISVLKSDISALAEENEKQDIEIQDLRKQIAAFQEKTLEQTGKIGQLRDSVEQAENRAKEEIQARTAAQMALAKSEAKLESLQQLQAELREALSSTRKAGEEVAELRGKYSALLESQTIRRTAGQ